MSLIVCKNWNNPKIVNFSTKWHQRPLKSNLSSFIISKFPGTESKSNRLQGIRALTYKNQCNLLYFRAKRVYICGQLVYTFGMVSMALFRVKAAVIVFSACAGVMYSTLFTMPYVIIAHYHERDLVSLGRELSSSFALHVTHICVWTTGSHIWTYLFLCRIKRPLYHLF